MVSPLDFGEIISKSKTRISISQLMKNEGYSNQDEFISWLMSDSLVPALCIDGCRVEPDGKCPHGNPSPLKVLGYY